MNAKELLKLGTGGVLCGFSYVLILVVSILIFGAMLVLPERMGADDFMFQQTKQNDSMLFAAVPLLLIQLVLPFFAARWFYRACDRLATRFFYPAPNERNT